MATAPQTGPQFPPAPPIGRAQIAGVLAAPPAGETGKKPHRAAQHGRGRAAALAAGRPPLVTTVRPEQLLERIVGARPIGDRVRSHGTGLGGSCGSPPCGHGRPPHQADRPWRGGAPWRRAARRSGGAPPWPARRRHCSRSGPPGWCTHPPQQAADPIPQGTGVSRRRQGVGTPDRRPQALRALAPAGASSWRSRCGGRLSPPWWQRGRGWRPPPRAAPRASARRPRAAAGRRR